MTNKFQQKMLSNMELAEFCNQMGMILRSGISALVVVILLTKVLPIFHQVFEQLGQEMSGFSSAYIIFRIFCYGSRCAFAFCKYLSENRKKF